MTPPLAGGALAGLAPAPAPDLAAIFDALTDLRAIQVMAMLLISFGFLMVFRKPAAQPTPIEELVLAEFAAVSLLIAAGHALLQERLQSALNLVDSCGVLSLHGPPGLLGGQALVSGLLVGQLIALSGACSGACSEPYREAEGLLVE